MERIEALAKYLECSVDELKEIDDDTFEYGRQEYLVLTDDEANEKAKENILESLWAFNSDFLAAHAREGIDADVFRSIQANKKCEDNNKVITALIEDLDHFVDDAIKSDGRGSFMNSYDGDEHEVYYAGEKIDKKGIVQTEYSYYYIYRIN